MSGRGDEAGESSGSQEPTGAAEPQKRRPGRPRKPQKEPSGEPVPKRPRGRPKGSKNKGPSKAAQKPQQVIQKKPAQHLHLKVQIRFCRVSIYKPGEFDVNRMSGPRRQEVELRGRSGQRWQEAAANRNICTVSKPSTCRPGTRGRSSAAWLLKAVTCIDLTTLAGDDTPSNVHRLCLKAIQPIRHDLLRKLDMNDKGVTTAAVCVYPSRVADAVTSLKAANSSLPVASVATGFPAGQTPLETRLQEVRMAVSDGATEIDIVINRTLALTGQWKAMYDEIRQFREACGDAHMKTILAIGELGTFTNVYKASMVAMMAGSDFIKTSTGKESVNATYPVAIVMVRAIRDYFLCTGHK
ncbi:hypothetical protein F2P81_009657, partial [Scophthalmus maximus]